MRRSFFIDLDVEFLGFRQHRDGRRRGVDTARPLRSPARAGTAVHARFELQSGENAAARDGGDRLLVAADAGVGELEDLETPAMLGGVALVIRKKIGGGNSARLVAAGAGRGSPGWRSSRRPRPWASSMRFTARSSSGRRFLRAAASSSAIAFMSGSAAMALGILELALGLAPFADGFDQRTEIGRIPWRPRRTSGNRGLPADSAACSSAWRAEI